jgi:amino acid transporter
VRSQAVACQDGAGPAALACVRADGTPQRLVLVSGLLATLTAVGAYTAAGASADRYFAAALSLSIGAIALSYIAVFAALPRLRRTEPHVHRPYRVPGGEGGVWFVSGLAIAWTVVSLALLVWPPDLPAAFAGQRGTYELTQIIPLALLVVAGAMFAAAGRRGDGPSLAPAPLPRAHPLPVRALVGTVAVQASRLPTASLRASAAPRAASGDRAALPGIGGTQRRALATFDEGET